MTSTYETHIQKMIALGGMHECASDCPQPTPRIPLNKPQTVAGQALLAGLSGIAAYRPRGKREVVGIRDAIHSPPEGAALPVKEGYPQ